MEYNYAFEEILMPNPFILFENHVSASTRQFIADNAAALKALGYKKFLFEMNSEISPAQIKQQFRLIVSNPRSAFLAASSQAGLNMLEALEKNGIAYEFIDPETQADALQQNLKLMVSRDLEARKRHVKTRDDKMAATISKQAELHDGGIFFIGGFQHNSLINLLDTCRTDYYRYALFTNSNEKLQSDFSEGKSIESESNRKEFYGVDVAYFDMSLKPSFEMIAAEAKLTSDAKCSAPLVGEYLQEALKQPCEFTCDTQHVVSAVLTVNNERVNEVTNSLRSNFKGLNFFMRTQEAGSRISIPGINLPENSTALKDGFRALGVMK